MLRYFISLILFTACITTAYTYTPVWFAGGVSGFCFFGVYHLGKSDKSK